MTGVQTCALPIYSRISMQALHGQKIGVNCITGQKSGTDCILSLIHISGDHGGRGAGGLVGHSLGDLVAEGRVLDPGAHEDVYKRQELIQSLTVLPICCSVGAQTSSSG